MKIPKSLKNKLFQSPQQFLTKVSNSKYGMVYLLLSFLMRFFKISYYWIRSQSILGFFKRLPAIRNMD